MDMARISPGSVRPRSHCNVVGSLLAISRLSRYEVREGKKAKYCVNCEGFGDLYLVLMRG